MKYLLICYNGLTFAYVRTHSTTASHTTIIAIDSKTITLQNDLLYYHQRFNSPTSGEHLGLDCKVEYMNANQGILPEAHNIWVQYMQSEENNLNNTFQGQIPFVPILYFS